MLQKAASTELTVETRDVRLDYGDLTAVNNVNLQIGPGEIYGLVGPNGAGKSSLLKMLANLNRPTYGEIFINGIDLAVVFEMEENVVYIASGSPFTLIILAAQAWWMIGWT
ncbi:MAG: ATP-binding cassette domain-containing protein [Pseudomonadales bacterium]|jgi:ABC-type multidrug transport system ATPase subunit|nr:ATP-binding cassette domain-containing protein [Pseudomonadales bacterium]